MLFFISKDEDSTASFSCMMSDFIMLSLFLSPKRETEPATGEASNDEADAPVFQPAGENLPAADKL